MPLSRSNTRSKVNLKPSISHVSATRTMASSLRPSTASPRTFLPPSYYAAAAVAWEANIDGDSLDHENISISEKLRPDARSYRAEADNHSMDVNSVVSLTPSSRPRSHTISGHLKPDKSFDTDKRESRQSRLPNLEALLLPSLRDTVDRMTRPQEKQSQSSLSDSASRPGSHLSYKSRLTDMPAPSTSSMIPRIPVPEQPNSFNAMHHSQNMIKRKSSTKSVTRTPAVPSTSPYRAKHEINVLQDNYPSTQNQTILELVSNRTYSDSARVRVKNAKKSSDEY
jgi:hypothetical protein